MLKKVLKWTVWSWAVLFVLGIIIVIVSPDSATPVESNEPKNSVVTAVEEVGEDNEDEKSEPVVKKEKKEDEPIAEEVAAQEDTDVKENEPTVEGRISEVIGVEDSVQFTEDKGFAFVIVKAPMDDEISAKEILRIRLKELASIPEIERMVVNVQNADGSILLIKYEVSGDNLRAIDFGDASYGSMLDAAEHISGIYAR